MSFDTNDFWVSFQHLNKKSNETITDVSPNKSSQFSDKNNSQCIRTAPKCLCNISISSSYHSIASIFRVIKGDRRKFPCNTNLGAYNPLERYICQFRRELREELDLLPLLG